MPQQEVDTSAMYGDLVSPLASVPSKTRTISPAPYMHETQESPSRKPQVARNDLDGTTSVVCQASPHRKRPSVLKDRVGGGVLHLPTDSTCTLSFVDCHSPGPGAQSTSLKPEDQEYGIRELVGALFDVATLNCSEPRMQHNLMPRDLFLPVNLAYVT